MYIIPEYLERDPNKKNVKWANTIITELRRHMQDFVDVETCKTNMQVLLNTYDYSEHHTKKMFRQNGKNSKISFIPLAVIEKYRNILLAERHTAGVNIGLQTVDPSVVDKERKADLKILKTKKQREAIINNMRARIKDVPFKIDEKYFKGNIDSFYSLGLDDEDDENLNYFFSTFWRLMEEIVGETVLMALVKDNKLKELIPYFCNDILAKKAVSMRVYVNQMSGRISVDYLSPEQVKLIPGKKMDYSDSSAIEVADTYSVSQIISMLGDEFTEEVDWMHFINAVNTTYSRSYNGITHGGRTIYSNHSGADEKVQKPNYADYDTFMRYKLPLHYIEFKSIDSTYIKEGKSVSGNKKFYLIDADQEVKSEYYQKSAINNEVTYRAYYFPISGNTQRVFKFGKLFHQTVKGGEDEYSNYSICLRKEPGPTAVDVMFPMIVAIQKAWVKFEWMVQKAKPAGRSYSYESLVDIAQHMIRNGDNQSKIKALLAMFEEGVNDIYTIPKVNGEKIGGGANPYFDKKNGLDASAKDFLDVIVWCHEKMSSDLGVNSILAENNGSPSAPEGYKLQMQMLQQSRKATQYISSMLMDMLNHAGSQFLLITQDVIKYKTSLPYKWLKTLVGEATVNALSHSKFAHHRLGIYVDSFNNDFERAEFLELAKQAYLNQEIDLSQYMLIKSHASHSKALMILAYEKRRQEKLKMQQEAEKNNMLMQIEAQRHNNKMDEIGAEVSGKLAETKMEVDGRLREMEMKTKSDESRKEMDVNNQRTKQENKEEADREKRRDNANIQNQVPL